MVEPRLEPWLRGTLEEFDPVRRAVLHALELAGEDGERWASRLSEEQVNARPFGLPGVGYQMRHLVRSLDRLLTYAEGGGLSEAQLAALRTEQDWVGLDEVFGEFRVGLDAAMRRVRGFSPDVYGEERFVGRDRLKTTCGGLLIHCAEHTQRHVGQLVTTAKVVVRDLGAGMEWR